MKPILKKPLFYGVYLIVSILGILVFMELALALAHSVTDDHRLATDPGSGPADPPKIGLKIALFGGSSAYGAYSPVRMDQVIETELRRRYSGLKFHFSQYAASGAPFHRQQAELLKSVIDKHDVFLIYSGHNESTNYYDDIGYYRAPENKDKKHLKPFEPPPSGPIEWVKTHSRIFAITRKINEKYLRPHVQSTYAKTYQPRKHRIFEAERALPPEAVQAMYDNFETDLREIAAMAEERGKTVIVSSVASPERYSPVFSVHRVGLG